MPTAQEQADARYAGEAGPLWRVELGGWPAVVLPAAGRAEATERYFDLVGVTACVHRPSAELVEDYPHPLPEGPAPVYGLKEWPDGPEPPL